MASKYGTQAGRSAGAADAKVFIDENAVKELINSKDGIVAKDIARRAIKIDRRAKTHCPVDTGRLRSSIAWRMGKDNEGLYAQIGTNVHYAIHVEEGTFRMDAQPFLRPALEAGN